MGFVWDSLRNLIHCDTQVYNAGKIEKFCNAERSRKRSLAAIGKSFLSPSNKEVVVYLCRCWEN